MGCEARLGRGSVRKYSTEWRNRRAEVLTEASADKVARLTTHRAHFDRQNPKGKARVGIEPTHGGFAVLGITTLLPRQKKGHLSKGGREAQGGSGDGL